VASQNQKAIFAGGCFWCAEALFRCLKGVISARPGYAGGAVENPTYEQVSFGGSGHAEAVEIEFDPEQISYEDLLTVFFFTYDPTTLNRQGNDVGHQYRSAIFSSVTHKKDRPKTSWPDWLKKRRMTSR